MTHVALLCPNACGTFNSIYSESFVKISTSCEFLITVFFYRLSRLCCFELIGHDFDVIYSQLPVSVRSPLFLLAQHTHRPKQEGMTQSVRDRTAHTPFANLMAMSKSITQTRVFAVARAHTRTHRLIRTQWADSGERHMTTEWIEANVYLFIYSTFKCNHLAKYTNDEENKKKTKKNNIRKLSTVI